MLFQNVLKTDLKKSEICPIWWHSDSMWPSPLDFPRNVTPRWLPPVFPQDLVAGVVVVQSKGDLQHQGITLTMEGMVNLQLSAKSVGVFEAFYNSIKVSSCNSSSIHVFQSLYYLWLM